jgi:predicted ferric reductase
MVNRNGASDEIDALGSAVSLQTVALMFLAVIAGAFAAVVILPAWMPGLAASMVGSEPKAYWYLSRASGFVAYGLVWASMVFGLLLTNKLARVWPGGPTAFDLHQYVSLLGLAFGLFHALILLGDRYVKYTLVQVLMPFASTGYRPLLVGLGQVGFYIMIIVSATFYIRKRIGQRSFRAIHMMSFAMFLLALVHGLGAGTDSTTPWAGLVYWLTGGSVLFLTVYRILVTRAKPQRAVAAARPRP